jgi:hypothetical protein
VPPTPKRMVWSVTEASRRMVQRLFLCCSGAALSWFCGLVNSQYQSTKCYTKYQDLIKNAKAKAKALLRKSI